ncbi:MAG: lysophospholipid acyltransferase family protein [Nitrospinae bacterium]|nr:lysophospholipid acyltransferase family protein [Nitrospinota bacterium]
MKMFFNSYVAAPLVFAILYLLSMTLRLHEEGKDIEQRLLDEGKSCVLTLWHGRLPYLAYYYRKTPERFMPLASPSADGEIVSRVLAMFGYRVVRGSSYKNPAPSLLTLARGLKAGYAPVLIADGSRGPLYKLQPGSMSLSKLTGAPALPITVSFSRHWTLGTWDRLMVPKPFSKVVVVYGEPVYAPRDCGEEELEQKRLEMEARLLSITKRADSYFGEAV